MHPPGTRCLVACQRTTEYTLKFRFLSMIDSRSCACDAGFAFPSLFPTTKGRYSSIHLIRIHEYATNIGHSMLRRGLFLEAFVNWLCGGETVSLVPPSIRVGWTTQSVQLDRPLPASPGVALAVSAAQRNSEESKSIRVKPLLSRNGISSFLCDMTGILWTFAQQNILDVRLQ